MSKYSGGLFDFMLVLKTTNAERSLEPKGMRRKVNQKLTNTQSSEQLNIWVSFKPMTILFAMQFFYRYYFKFLVYANHTVHGGQTVHAGHRYDESMCLQIL